MSKFKFTQEEREELSEDVLWGLPANKEEAIDKIESIISERYVSDDEIEKNAIDKFPPDKWSKSHRAFCIGSAKLMRSRIFKNEQK